MSVLLGQKLVKNAKIQKFKCDIWGDFQTLLLKSSKRKIFRFCSFRSPSIYVDRFNFKGKICKKKLFPFSSLKRSFMQKSPSYARRISFFKAKNKPSEAQYHSISRQICPFTFRICHVALPTQNAASLLQCLKITQNVAFEFLNFGFFYQFLSY